MKDAMLEALEEIENGMCRIKERRSIWQNSLDMGVCLKIYSDGNVRSADWQKRNPDDFCSYGERKDGAEC